MMKILKEISKLKSITFDINGRFTIRPAFQETNKSIQKQKDQIQHQQTQNESQWEDEYIKKIITQGGL